MAMTLRRSLLILLAVLTGTLASAATLPTTSLRLDGSARGGLLLYNQSSGQWFNAVYDASQGGGFGYAANTWGSGWSIYPARLNADTLTDAFLYNATTGQYAFAIRQSNGKSYTLTMGQWSVGWVVKVADFNGDGVHDIFVYDPVTGVWFQCTNSGSQTFTYFSGTAFPVNRKLTIGDFDGDGRTDVFAYDPVGGGFAEYITTTAGVNFDTARTGQWDPGWEVHAAALNTDASTDLFLYQPSTGLWFQAFSTASSAVFTYRGGVWDSGWQIHLGDFNADGLSDLFVYSGTTGLWFECFTTTAAPGFTYAGGAWSPGWELHVGDLDRDGRADVFVYDRTGALSPIGVRLYFQCLNRGSGVFAYVGGVWSPDWVIQSEVDQFGTVPVGPPPPPKVPTLLTPLILAFGDSITFGTGVPNLSCGDNSREPACNGYPGRLQSLLQARYPNQSIQVGNAGLRGEQAFFGSSRLAGILGAGSWNLVILLEGINDVLVPSPVSLVADSVRNLVQVAKGNGLRVILTTLTPAVPTGSRDVDVPRLLAVNEEIRIIARTEGVVLVDMYAVFQSQGGSLLLTDGLHPTTQGYQVIANTYFDAIVSNFEGLR